MVKSHPGATEPYGRQHVNQSENYAVRTLTTAQGKTAAENHNTRGTTETKTMHKQICSECLGDIDSELLLQNLTNTNTYCNTIDEIRFGLTELAKNGGILTVMANYEYEWQGDPNTTKPVSKRFVRIRQTNAY